MVVIRLTRRSRKKNPFYQIVVADCRHPRDGRFIERIGYYNPIAKGHDIMLQVEEERMVYWLNHGAQATLRVQHLIKKLKKSAEKVKKDSLEKDELRCLQSEQRSKRTQKAQAKVAEEANSERVKVEEVSVAKK